MYELFLSPVNVLASPLFPMQSLLNAGISVSSSTGFPAASIDYAIDIFSIIEIAANNGRKSWWLKDNVTFENLSPDELISVEDALRILTVNGAKQLGIEKDRGCIRTGKYAYFLLMDQDILECPKDNIHNTKLESVYFEGKEVWKQ